MRSASTILPRLVRVLLIIALSQTAPVHAAQQTRFAVSMDNDAFVLGGIDRDYTGAGRLISTTPNARLDDLRIGERLLSWLDHLSAWDRRYHESALPHIVDKTSSAGLLVFSPDDIDSLEPIAGERPYANLLYASRSRIARSADGRSAFQSTVTVGLMGTPLAEWTHKRIHQLTDAPVPRGYSRQLSDGGEPTLRYAAAHHRFLTVLPGRSFSGDVRLKVQGAVGFVTDAGGSITARFGRFPAGSWSLLGEQSHYLAQPYAPPSLRAGDWIGWASLGLRAQVYNALLQGQFRNRSSRIESSQVKNVLVDWGMGVAWAMGGNTTVSLAIRGSSPELRTRTARRSLRWGGVTVTRRLKP